MKFTAIWQGTAFGEYTWLVRLFEPYIEKHCFDGEYKIVLDNAILFDKFVHIRDKSYYAQFSGKNVFLVHLNDETYEGGDYSQYRNFRGVFRNYWSGGFNEDGVMALPLGHPKSDPWQAPELAASKRPYLWSFLGQAEKSSRPEVLRALRSVEPNFIYTTDIRPDGTRPALLTRQKCDQVLHESVFAPCPMGNVNLDSFRVYEALEAGTIPIVERRLTLDYFKSMLGEHPLPTVSSWNGARKLILTLRSNPAKMDALQNECRDWWQAYLVRLSGEIGRFLERRSSESRQVEPLRHSFVAFAGWKYLELMRHHSASAIGHRVKRQFLRIIKEKRWRHTYLAPKTPPAARRDS